MAEGKKEPGDLSQIYAVVCRYPSERAHSLLAAGFTKCSTNRSPQLIAALGQVSKALC